MDGEGRTSREGQHAKGLRVGKLGCSLCSSCVSYLAYKEELDHFLVLSYCDGIEFAFNVQPEEYSFDNFLFDCRGEFVF